MSIPIVRCRKGAVALEFVIVAPVLFLILFVIAALAIALNNQLILTSAAQQGAQVLSIGRGTTSAYSNAVAAINAAAVNLTTAQIVKTLSVGGTNCTSDTACGALLSAGAAASVALTYPCHLTVMGHVLGGSPCTLRAASAAVVQ